MVTIFHLQSWDCELKLLREQNSGSSYGGVKKEHLSSHVFLEQQSNERMSLTIFALFFW